MPHHIVEDFAAIRERLAQIHAAEHRGDAVVSTPSEEPQQADQEEPADFYGWLMGGGLWSGGQSYHHWGIH